MYMRVYYELQLYTFEGVKVYRTKFVKLLKRVWKECDRTMGQRFFSGHDGDLRRGWHGAKLLSPSRSAGCGCVGSPGIH